MQGRTRGAVAVGALLATWVLSAESYGDAPAKDATGCDALQACCASLPDADQRAGCARVVGLKDAATCTSTLQTMRAAGACSADGGQCAAVAACCAKAPADKKNLCRDVLAAKNENSCSIAIPQLRPSCPDLLPAPGAAPSSPAPPPTGRLCTAFRSCCSSLKGPYRQQCDTVLSTAGITEAQCGGYLQQNRSRKVCKAEAKGCALLAACAPQVRPEHAGVCAAAIKKGNDAGCFSILGTMQQVGSCLDV